MNKIDKWKSCRSPEHKPPMSISIPNGEVYYHICPGCGNKQIIKSQDIKC